MKAASAGLITLLNSGQEIYKADCYTITLNDGTALRYTSWDVDLTVGGNTFLANQFAFTRNRVNSRIGLEVTTLDLEVAALSTPLIAGVPFLQAVQQGVFDKATVKLEYAFMQTAGNTANGTITQFLGRISDSKAGRSSASITVASMIELLNVKLPRILYQPACWHTLFDTGCTLSAAAFQVSSSVASGSTKSVINCALAQAAGYFDLGKIVFTSGVNNGQVRGVRSYVPGILSLAFPLFNTPGIGDTFNAFPGCDKQSSTCTTKFSNLANFGGFPYVPPPETAL